MYLTNNQRLDLNLIGQCDRPASEIQAAITASGKTGYYVQDVTAAPAPARTGGTGGGGTHGTGTGTTKR